MTTMSAPSAHWWGGRRRRLIAVAVAALVVLAVIVMVVRQQTGSGITPAAAADTLPGSLQRPSVSAAGLAQRSGVQITRVTLSGGGGLVDLRFRVVDAERATSLHAAATPTALVDESTGAVVKQLLMSHSHTDAFKAGHVYYLIYENPGNLVHHGSRVTVLLGNAQVEHVVVP
ncbi:MAG: hypothetical protein WCB04_09165 [Mycobacteriales bacterium]